MPLELQLYHEQLEIWPPLGRHILAQFDDDSVVVYQAYNERIGHFAAQNGHFGDDFSFNRMSWIKPNFLWMAYRSGWGQKPNQTCVLAIRIKRALWEEILSLGVPSSFVPELFESEREWKREVAKSEVRLQWDPDHLPRGQKAGRRAVQLGLRGETLRRFATSPISIEDISSWVREQHQIVESDDWSALQLPRERVYPVGDSETARRLGLGLLDTSRAGEKGGS